jgi:hypothetical protein
MVKRPMKQRAEPAPKKRAERAKSIVEAMGDTAPSEEAVAPALAGDAPPIAAVGEPEPAPKKGKNKRVAAAKDATLADVFAGYLRGLEESGKSEGTIFSYRLELVLAGAELGIDTRLADLTPERVLLFFGSDRATKTRTGRAKSPLSIDKTRRVLRQALVWAETAKMVDKAPLPELTANY